MKDKKCLKCGYLRKVSDDGPEYACPRCGAVYAKVEAAIERERQLSPKEIKRKAHIELRKRQKREERQRLERGQELMRQGLIELQKQQEQKRKQREQGRQEPSTSSSSADTLSNSEVLNPNLTKCKACQKAVAKMAEVCPHCGVRLPGVEPGEMGCGVILLIVFVGAIFAFVWWGLPALLFTSSSSPSSPSSEISTEKPRYSSSSHQRNYSQYAGDWQQPWSSEKRAAAQRCAKRYEDYRLQAVCMDNEKDGYDKIQGNFGLPSAIATSSKSRCAKTYESFALQAVCMENINEGYQKMQKY